ncbi:MAG: class I SAM-dependent methyltransferase [Terriglobia bacterium]
MSESASRYAAIYRTDVAVEAEWLRLGGNSKAGSIDLLTSRLPRPLSTLCEMGCGTGAVLEECIRRGLAMRYFGVDASAEALEWTRRDLGEGITLIHHDLEAGAPDLGMAVDLVVLSHVLEHLKRPEILLDGLAGRCRHLVAEVPLENQIIPAGRAWVRSAVLKKSRTENLSGHVQFFSKASFRKLIASCGWAIIAEYTYVPYRKDAIIFSARRNDLSTCWSLAPYFLSRLLGDPVASRLLCAHYAVLAARCSR